MNRSRNSLRGSCVARVVQGMKQRHGGLLLILALAACDGVFFDPHTTPDALSPIDGKIVFTSSKRYRGGLLDGVQGADSICANLASTAGLTGDFKAWISQLGWSAADRLGHSPKPYILVDRTTTVANSWVDLVGSDLLHAIDHDEYGVALVPDSPNAVSVWTATQTDGSESPWTPGGTPTENPRRDCTLWSSFDTAVGMLGIWTETDRSWTASSSGILCTETAHLYCFQQ